MVRMAHRQILLDIAVQADFFLPGGSCYSRESKAAAKRIRELFGWVRREKIPVISTVLRVRPRQRGPLAPVPHCVDGGRGERKLRRTVLSRRVNLGMRNSTDLPPGLFDRYQQIIFEQRVPDILRHAAAERLITELPLVTFIICGAGTAGGIVDAAIGLRSRGFGVVVASDAILDLGDPLADMARGRMEAKGVVFAKTSDIVSPPALRRPVPMRQAHRRRRQPAPRR